MRPRGPKVTRCSCRQRQLASSDTYYARSANPSEGSEKNVQVNDGTGNVAGFLGDYKGIAISGSDVIVVWNDTRSGSHIYSARAVGAAAP